MFTPRTARRTSGSRHSSSLECRHQFHEIYRFEKVTKNANRYKFELAVWMSDAVRGRTSSLANIRCKAVINATCGSSNDDREEL